MLPLHAMTAYRWSKGIFPLILHFGKERDLLNSGRPLCLLEKNPDTLYIGVQVGSRNSTDFWNRGKSLVTAAY
jgi:hypothetical protein